MPTHVNGLEAQYNSVGQDHRQNQENLRLWKFGTDKRISNEGVFLASADGQQRAIK